jgi:hypothetical protein
VSYPIAFLQALLITVSTETVILRLLEPRRPLKEVLFAGFLASTLTLPYLWFVLPQFISDYALFLIVGELSVALVEAVLYFFVLRVSAKKALFLSFTCNLISFLLGLLMQNLLH